MIPLKVFLLVVLSKILLVEANHDRPNIIVIIADDLGWNDVGFHGSSQIPTPNIDALAYNGIILDNFYTQASDTAALAAFYTGVYPIRYGFQGGDLNPGDPTYVPLQIPLISERLRDLEYRNYLVGKWNLGYAKNIYTPTLRGFHKFFGTYNKEFAYFNYKTSITDPITGHRLSGMDLHDGFLPVKEAFGQYATDIFTEKAVEYIQEHDQDKPMFLVLSHLAPHDGNHGKMQIPEILPAYTKYDYIQNPFRRVYADMVSRLDDSVGKIIEALAYTKMLENSIVLFMSDNTAKAIPNYPEFANWGSNWPFRGLKSTLFEGGVKGTAVLYSPLLAQKNIISKPLMHMVDLFPTLYYAAGGDVIDLEPIDGIDQWYDLQHNTIGDRESILLNIDEENLVSGLIADYGHYKLLNGTLLKGRISDGYYGDSGRLPETPPYNYWDVIQSPTNLAIQKQHKQPKLYDEKIWKMREKLDVKCKRTNTPVPCLGFCLFDLHEDPCETTNLWDDDYDKLDKQLLKELYAYWQEYVPQFKPFVDLNSDPVFYDNVWSPWLDKQY